MVEVGAFLAFDGVLNPSWLLVIVWDFNEDSHGSFRVACKRIGLLGSLRTATGRLAVILGYASARYIYQPADRPGIVLQYVGKAL